VHAGERANRVRRKQIAEAVAPAHDPVDEPDVGQRPQVADDEPRVHGGLRGDIPRTLDLRRRDVDADRCVTGSGQSYRQPPVTTWHVEHRGSRCQSEQPAHQPRVRVGHRGAGGSPEAGRQTTVKADIPIVLHPSGNIPRESVLFNQQDKPPIGRAHAPGTKTR
jgi:hypothetical protein